MTSLYIEEIENSDYVVLKGNVYAWRTLIQSEGGEYDLDVDGYLFADREVAENALYLAIEIHREREKMYGHQVEEMPPVNYTTRTIEGWKYLVSFE